MLRFVMWMKSVSRRHLLCTRAVWATLFVKTNSGEVGGEGGHWDCAGEEVLRAQGCLQKQQEPEGRGRGGQGLKRS